MSTQPAFWLQITDQYVIENFEELLRYVRNYNYDAAKEPEEGDFKRTYRHLKQVADGYAAQVKELRLFDAPHFNIPVDKVIRIMAASILTAKKMDIDDFDLLAALVNLLILNNRKLSKETDQHYFDIIRHCISRTPVKNYNFSWYTIEEESFMTGALEEKLGNTEFEAGADDINYFYENHGCLVKRKGELLLTNVNYQDIKGRTLRTELRTELGLEVRTTSATRKNGIDDLLDLYPVIPGEFDKMRPTPVVQRKEYRPEDSRMVRITNVFGVKVEGVTVDPGYEQMSGNVFLDDEIMKIPKASFLHGVEQRLRAGQSVYLPVKGGGETGLTFRIDWEWIGDLIEDFAEDIRNDEEELEAFFVEDYNGGTRWVSQEGILINVSDYFSASVKDELDAARRDMMWARFNIVNSKRNGATCIVNGRFNGIAGSRTPVFDPVSERKRAFALFMENMLDDTAVNIPEISDRERVGTISPYLIRLLAALTYRLGYKLNHGDSSARIEYFITAMLLMRMSGSEADTEYIHAQLDYQKVLIGFAQGKSPSSLTMHSPEGIDYVKEIQTDLHIVDIINSYRESTDTLAAGDSLAFRILPRGDAANADLVERLVDASNNLLGKIDETEINRIKKTICVHLDVDDQYKNIYTDGTNYGVESEFLEFKASCVQPPSEWRTTSLERDMEVQKWNILKAVCAFLNSMTGGDLLIGVNDAGFAVGLKDDVWQLFNHHRISEPTVDRLRLYVKLFIDSAFITHDRRVKGTAITNERVKVNIESDDRGREILRVKVSPYPWDVVRIDLPDRPSRFDTTYIRTSGASTPLTSAGIRETKLRKIKALDKDDYKTARILQAIDDKLVVEIRNYSGHDGISNRRVEPFKILDRYKAFLGYDLDRRDMRMFKFSRFSDTGLVLTDAHWRNEAHHVDRDIDIFGMARQNHDSGIPVEIMFSEYARNLLIDECNLDAESVGEVFTANTDRAWRDRYPWVLRVTINSIAGIARFMMGLPGHTRIVRAEGLADYIRNARGKEEA